MPDNTIHHDPSFPAAAQRTLSRYVPMPTAPSLTFGADPISAAIEGVIAEWPAENAALVAGLQAHAEATYSANQGTSAALGEQDSNSAARINGLGIRNA
ncbi:Uncharacterised protein [Mycobacteroides abscessus subsp. abscessus]|uniref:hypothetical protein n=1 Tax=Mycobacteroides abscessus TaxID=36809 RepID=UPI0009A83835|nr:hypothetical protein [Mycobacteroides abscessus]SLI19228.1 Uncharacterised protein [Mycobacteroides abscessus subsp. abscessus]